MIKTVLMELANRIEVRHKEALVNVGGNEYAKGLIHAYKTDLEDLKATIKRMEEGGILSE